MKKFKSEQAELRRRFRAARACGDEQRMAELSPALEAIARELARVDSPHHARGWDLSRATREGGEMCILDWTTGY